MTDLTLFNDAAREAGRDFVRRERDGGIHRPLVCEDVDRILAAALKALPERSKAILALAALSDDTIKRAVFDGVSQYCEHGGPMRGGYYCCYDCERISDEVLRFLTALGLPVAEREATG